MAQHQLKSTKREVLVSQLRRGEFTQRREHLLENLDGLVCSFLFPISELIFGKGMRTATFRFSESGGSLITKPPIHWIASPPYHWKPLFFLFHWKVLRRIPSPKIGSTFHDFARLSTTLHDFLPPSCTAFPISTRFCGIWDFVPLFLGRHACRTNLPPKKFWIDTKNGLKNAKKDPKNDPKRDWNIFSPSQAY